MYFVRLGRRKPRNTVSSRTGAKITVVSTRLAAPPGPAAKAFSITELLAVPWSSPLRPSAYARAVTSNTNTQVRNTARAASPNQSSLFSRCRFIASRFFRAAAALASVAPASTPPACLIARDSSSGNPPSTSTSSPNSEHWNQPGGRGAREAAIAPITDSAKTNCTSSAQTMMSEKALGSSKTACRSFAKSSGLSIGISSAARVPLYTMAGASAPAKKKPLSTASSAKKIVGAPQGTTHWGPSPRGSFSGSYFSIGDKREASGDDSLLSPRAEASMSSVSESAALTAPKGTETVAFASRDAASGAVFLFSLFSSLDAIPSGGPSSSASSEDRSSASKADMVVSEDDLETFASSSPPPEARARVRRRGASSLFVGARLALKLDTTPPRRRGGGTSSLDAGGGRAEQTRRAATRRASGVAVERNVATRIA